MEVAFSGLKVYVFIGVTLLAVIPLRLKRFLARNSDALLFSNDRHGFVFAAAAWGSVEAAVRLVWPRWIPVVHVIVRGAVDARR